MHDSSGQPACGYVLICQLKIWPSLHSTSESRLLLQVQKPSSLMQRLVFQPAEPILLGVMLGGWMAASLAGIQTQLNINTNAAGADNRSRHLAAARCAESCQCQ